MRRFYTNGDIITLDRRYSKVEVVVTEDDIISKLGDKSLLSYAESSEVIDLKGRTLLPGFVVASSLREEKTYKNGITTVILNKNENSFKKIDSYKFIDDSSITNSLEKDTNIVGRLIVLDGSLLDKKAYLSSPYHIVPNGELISYSGIGNYKYIEIKRFINEASKCKIPLKAIANGSASIELFLNAYEKLYCKGMLRDMKCILSGCETATENQIERMRMLKIIAEFPIWTLYCNGEYYRDSALGVNNVEHILQLQTCCLNGLPFSIDVGNHSVLEALQIAVIRRTANNSIIGKSQRITPLRALRAVTINGALSIGQSGIIGSISPLKKADFVVLSDNPCKVSKSNIGDIEVLETVKNGKTIYKKY